MLILTGFTLTASLIYLRFFAKSYNYPLDDLSTITNWVLFIALFFIARYIYGVNVKRLEIINKQLNELHAQIKERKKVEDENIRLALYDHLTGLPNRLLFTANLHREIEHAKTSKLGLYVMFIDIDFFKRINDMLGHASGDQLLIQVGERIVTVLRNSDSVCRVGGDEFLVMVGHINSEQQVLDMARRLLDQLNKPFNIDKHQVEVTCSIGIAKSPEDGADVEALIKSADFAMYKAKQDGKNRYEIYSSELQEDANKEIRMINAIQDALINNEFVLFYQPQVEGASKKIIGYEALIRWNHPEQGIISPNNFIPIAEKTGLIIPVGEWVLRTACRQNKQWQDMGMPKVPVSVNISAIQIKNSPLYKLLRDVLSDTKLAPEYLELEITESMIIFNEKIRLELEKIKSLGVKISIDDFGTGYSAIQYLKNYPIDRLKIPMEFIHGININDKDESIINVILALAESLHIDVIAEGVENESQYQFLSERSCRNIQGFLFYRPLPADSISGLSVNEKCAGSMHASQ